MIMLRDFTVTIMHAENASKNINIGRGCRQGDPIASLLFILCIEILLIMIRTSRVVKPFKINYTINPFTKTTVNKYMEGFADDITLSTENSISYLKNITKIVEDFGHLSGLRINRDKTQAMIFGKDSRTQIPAINNLGFTWVKKNVIGIKLTCDLKEIEKNFQEKLESIEKMLKHWSYRTLNLEGSTS